MTDEISPEDTQQGIAKRDSDGKLFPEDHEVELPHGETVTVKTRPITTGLLNELSDVDEAIDNLEPDAIHEAFQTIYVSDALRDMSVKEIRDTRSSYLMAYLQPLNDAVEKELGENEMGNAEVARNEQAQTLHR